MPTSTNNGDPRFEDASARQKIRRQAFAAAVATGLVYGAYRLAFTLGGTALPNAALLLAAEMLGLLIFVVRFGSATHRFEAVADVPEAPVPSSTAVIDAAGSNGDDLRTTLVSCQRTRGLDSIVVADPADDNELRQIALRFDARFVPRPALELIAEANVMWALHLRAGDMPLPDAVEMLATMASSPQVGVIQLGTEAADPSSYEYDPTSRWSAQAFEHQVLRPSMAARASLPWYGDTPALVRPTAIAGEGAPRSTAEAGLRAARSGYTVTVFPRPLAKVRGSRSLAEHLHNHCRTFTPIRRLAMSPMSGVPKQTARYHRVALAGSLAALQRMMLVVVAIAALAFGQLPVQGNPLLLGILAGLAYGSRRVTELLVARGRLGPLTISRSGLRTMAVDIGFGLSSRPYHRASMTVLSVMVGLLLVGVGALTVAVWNDWSNRLSTGPAVVAALLVLSFSALGGSVMVDALIRRQWRRQHRIRLSVIGCRVGGLDGQLQDLSTGGAGVTLAAATGSVPRSGSTTSLEFRIPDAAGGWVDVNAAAKVVHTEDVGSGHLRLGLAFLEATDRQLDPVVEFLTVDRRLVTLGRRSLELSG